MKETMIRPVFIVATNDWREAFAGHLAATNRSERTVRAYLQDLRTIATWFEAINHEPFSPERITSMDVRAYRRHVLDGQGAPSTWNRRLAALGVFAKWAIGAGYLSYDPTEGVEAKPEEELPPRWLTKAELNRLLRVCEQNVHGARTAARGMSALSDQAMIYLMAFAGLREGELMALEATDVQISDRKGRVIVRSGKGEKRREVPLSAEARRVVMLWVIPLHLGSRLFPMTARTVQRRVAELGRLAGIELTPHDLRHTFAKRLVDEGTPLNVVQKLLGHARVDTTLRYTKPGWEDYEDAVEKI